MDDQLSEAEKVARLGEAERQAWFSQQSEPALRAKLDSWQFWCRPGQSLPPGDWRIWLVLAGRGFGKTRMGAEWVRMHAQADPSAHIAIVGATHTDVRAIMVEGESGLLSIAPAGEAPTYESSLRKLTWPSGATATLYSASEPESLRGPQHQLAWCDELAKWERGDATWNNLTMTLRTGAAPQVMVTTTPRPTPLIRRLLGEPGLVMTRGKSKDNRANLASAWLKSMNEIHAGSTLGRQELDGEILMDVEGALWSRQLLDACRTGSVPAMRRIVIGVDPPVTAGGDACGIIVAGLGEDGRAYVLDDQSVHGQSPEGWARAVAKAARTWEADRVIAEANNGGDMVVSTLRAADVAMPVKRVHASRGKVARAEPVVTLYEAGRVRHAGAFAALEDELCGLVIGGGYEGPGRSPDRADACVWALTELMLGAAAKVPSVRWL